MASSLIQLAILITLFFSTAISITSHQLSPTHILAPILSHLGYQQLSTAAPFLPLEEENSSYHHHTRPLTVFAPSDSSLDTCPSCSLPYLLQEHIIPGLYTFPYLRTLAFGTKIETLLPNRCLTLTSDKNATKLFVGGVEITRPDLLNNGILVIHGLDGYVSRLSPISCHVEKLTSLSFVPNNNNNKNVPLSGYSYRAPDDDAIIMRVMLDDATLRLRISGFSVLALSLRVNYKDFLNINNMTVFAVDDASVFSSGHVYAQNIKFHIVPNSYLCEEDLERLAEGTEIPTMEEGKNLTVTSELGETERLLRINYVGIKNFGFISNLKIVFHQVYGPFKDVEEEEDYRPSMVRIRRGGIGRFRFDEDEVTSPSGEIISTAEIEEDYHGL